MGMVGAGGNVEDEERRIVRWVARKGVGEGARAMVSKGCWWVRGDDGRNVAIVLHGG